MCVLVQVSALPEGTAHAEGGGAAEIIVSADGRHAPLPCSFGLLWLSSQSRIADEEDVCGRFAYASVRMTGKANASPAAVFNTIATLSLDPTTGAW